MNKQAYRVIFNKARRMLMVVAENASRQSKGTAGDSDARISAAPLMRFAPLGLMVAALFGHVTVVQAQMVAYKNGGPRPTIDQSANGRPLVQIVTPNAAGVSHNRYDQYNVDSNGAILNNARTATQTQLGGYIDGNANLAGGSARIILNEVMGSGRSQLNGYTEVAGQRAEVIIANPNGITCSGCGFINTSRGVLTTGTPVFGGDGSLSALRVTRGDMQINGMNAGNTDQTDLIARSVQVNGQLWANNLNVVTGANQVNYGDLGVQVIQGEGAVPSVGIDVAALGGMYAGKIMLKGTEQGVGVVSAGNIAASAGDVTIDSAGLVRLHGATNASGNIALRSDADVSNDGALYAQQTMHIENAGQMRNSGTIAAGADVNVRAGSIDSRGTLGAGIDANGAANQPGSLALVADGAVAAVGQNIAADHIGIQGASLHLAGARTTAGGNVDLTATAGDIDHAGANLLAGGSSNVSAAGVLNNRQGEIHANQLNIHAANLDNQQGRLIQTGAAGGSVDVASTLDNRNGGLLQTNGDDLTLTPQTLLNDSGTIAHAGKGALTIGGSGIGTLSNQGGSIGSNGQLKVAMAAVNNQSGKLFAAQQAEIRSGNLNNSGGYIGAASLHLESATINNQGGTVESSAGDVTVSGTDFANDGGTLQSLGGNLTLDNNGKLSNRSGGFIGSSAVLTVHAGSIDNAGGAIYGAAGVSLASAGEFNNDGGAIQSDADADLQAGGALSNQGGRIEANGSTASLSLAAGTLDNSAGRIANAGTGTTSMRSAHIGNAGGVLGGNGDVTLTAGALDNSRQGQIIASGNLALQISNMFNNSAGKLYAGQSLAFDQAGAVIDNSNGSISADGNIILHSASIDNSSGSIVTGNGNIDLQQSGVIANNAGQIAAATDLDLAAGSLTGDGTVLAGRDAELRLQGDYTHSAANRITANRNLRLNAAGTLTNNGALQAANGLTLAAGNITNAQGALINSGATVLLAQQNLLNQGRIYGDDIALSAAALTNDADAVIASRNTLHIGAGTVINREHALLTSAGDMAIGGALDVNQQATGQSATITNSSAAIDAGGNLSLQTANLLNQNAHFSTEEQVDPAKTVRVTEYRSWDSDTWYRADQISWSDSGNGGIVLVLPDGSRYEKFYKRDYTLTVSQTVVKNSDPGKISVGGNLLLSGNVTNDKSAIIAGGTISGQTGDITNIGATGSINPVQHMTAGENYYHWVSGSSHDNHYTYDNNGQAYEVALPATDMALPVWSLQENTHPGHSDNPAAGQQVDPGRLPGATGGSLGSNQGGPGMSGTGQSVVGPDGKLPNLQLPTNQLYQLHPQPGQSYLIVTDPAFTNYQQFLSSDYLLGRLGIDPQAVQKRLGDGYYEQQLITSQVAQLTGRRYLDGYRSNEDAYRALMDAGVAAAQQFQLTPGVALTDAQMAALTSDIVWLVTQTVTLPDGSSTEVLAPVLYLARANAGDVRADGALIAGQNIDLSINGSLANGGTLQAGSNLIVNASGDISNSGRLQSTAKDGNGTVILAAQNDVRSSGSISGNRVGILAGRDIDLASTTSSATSKNGSNVGLNQIASVSADQLSMQSGRDINLNGAAINTTGDAAFVAGRDINLNTVTTQATSNVSYGNQNHLNESQTIANGASMQSGGNITLAAGQDVNANAAYVNADQALTVAAGRDVNITSAQQTYSKDQEISTTSKGMLSSSTYHYTDQQQGTQAVGSTFSGDSVQVVAGNDINVKGSNVVGTHDVTVAAGNNVNIVASQNTAAQSTSSEDKTSGMFSSGGIGFTAGSKEQQNTQTSHQLTHNVSMIGSTDGNVVIQAGNAYTQTGSNVLTPKGDTTIVARSVDINAAIDTASATQDTKFKQTGVSVTLTNAVVSAVQTGQQMHQSSQQIDDSRLKALAATTTGIAGANVAEALSNGTASAVNVSIGLGSSKSESHSEQNSTTVQGSNVFAGGNVNIIATGGGQASNINVTGSNIRAGNNANLIADNNINLQAAQNTAEQHSTNSSSSASVGIGFSVGGQSNGFTLNAGVSGGRGNADGNDVGYTNTHVTAGNQLNLVSGGDTNLIGAVASANKVLADVGGNLNIQSLQDTSNYNSKQQSAGVGVSLCIPPFCAGASSVSGNVSKTNMNSNYASVTEQSGIKAGDGGFDVTVQGNTNLVGGVISGTDKAVNDAKNSFTTGSLTQSDIQNHANYSGQSVSLGGGYNFGGPTGNANGVGTDQKGYVQTGSNQTPGTTLPSKNGLAVGAPIAMNAKGDANSTTQSGISGIAGNAAVRTGDAETGIVPIFDPQKIQAGFDITQAFGNQVSTYVNTKMSEADAKKQQANDSNNNLTPDQRQQLLDDASLIENSWGANGTYRQIATVLTAAASGNVAGSTTQMVQAGLVNYVQQQGASYIGKLVADGTLTEGSPEHAALHAIVACAGATASGQSCGAGAMGAAASSLLTNLFIDTPNETNAEKEAKGNLVTSLVAGLAAMTGNDASTVSSAATAAVDNNWLTPKLQITKAIAQRDCDGGNPKACGYVEELNKFDAETKKQLDQMVDACIKGAADACAQAKQVVASRTELAKGQIDSCDSASYSCIGMYQPSAKEIADALRQLPGAGSGAVVATMDPVTAAVLIRTGMVSPSVAAAGASVGSTSEWLNQTLYGDGTLNYERIANAGLISWASGGIGSTLNSLGSVAAFGGATNAAITAYNNSQTGSNDSIAWSALIGASFSAGGKIIGDAGGLYLNNAMNYTKKLDPKKAALLQPPGGVIVPVSNPSNLPWIFRNIGNTWFPGSSGAIPSVPVNVSGSKK